MKCHDISGPQVIQSRILSCDLSEISFQSTTSRQGTFLWDSSWLKKYLEREEHPIYSRLYVKHSNVSGWRLKQRERRAKRNLLGKWRVRFLWEVYQGNLAFWRNKKKSLGAYSKSDHVCQGERIIGTVGVVRILYVKKKEEKWWRGDSSKWVAPHVVEVCGKNVRGPGLTRPRYGRPSDHAHPFSSRI